MIYIMNTKTFKKIFAKEDPKKIEKTQFIIVSGRIRKSDEEDNVIFYKKLMPSDMLLADYRNEIDPDFFKNAYKKQLDKNRMMLSIIIKGVIEESYTVVFLCTYTEWQLRYLQILADYIMEEFNYPIIDYKKYKLKKKLPKIDFNPEYVIEACNSVIKKCEKQRTKSLMKTKRGRKTLLDNMSEDDMKRQLKKMGLYTSGLDKHTMKGLLKEFFVEGD